MSVSGDASIRLRVLFFMRSCESLGVFESLLLSLLSSGHEVQVALDHERRGLLPDYVRDLEQLQERHAGFSYVELRPRTDLWRIPADAVRRGLDYLLYLNPAGYATDELLADARARAPRLLRRLLVLPPFRWTWGRRSLGWLLRRIEAGMPIPRSVEAFVAEQSPGVVLISPLVGSGSSQGDYFRRVDAHRVPSVLLAAGTEDLRCKGAIRDAPTLTVVPGEAQAADAVQLQGLPPERVTVVADAPAVSTDSRLVEVIDETASSDVGRSHKGVLLRPIFWLLTPLLALVLPLLRPRATARATVRWARGRRRARRRRRRDAKARAAVRAKEKAHAARVEAKAKVARARADEKARTQAAKEAERKKAEAAKEAQRENALAAKEADKARAAAMQKAAKAKDEKKKAAKAQAVATGAKKDAVSTRSGTPVKKRARRARGRMRKAARGRVKKVRRGWKLTRRGVRRTYNRRYRYTYRKTIMRVPSRDELPTLLNARGLLGRGVEIGVKTGLYSDELLSNWRGEELISIDPWLSVDWEEYVDRSNVSQDEFERYYQITRERLAPHGNRSTIWRMTSIEAAEKVPDQSLDFAYIDARHDYESVKEDLAAWCAKVRPGGILAGHDYVDGDFPQGEFYVKSAVDEFFGERDIPVHGTEGPSAVELFPTWIVVVPQEGIRPPGRPSEAGDSRQASEHSPAP